MTSEQFATAIERAKSRNLSVVDLIGAAEQLSRQNDKSLLKELYSTWIAHNASDPLLYAVYFNYGVILMDGNELAEARAAFSESITVNPVFWPGYINLATVHERMGVPAEAVKQWSHVVNSLPTVNADGISHKLTALKQLGRVLETAQIEPNAEEALRMSLEIDPRQRDVLQHWLSIRQTQCRWPLVEAADPVGKTRLIEGLSPLSLGAYSDDPLFQLANAYRYFDRDVASTDRMFAAGGWTVPAKPRSPQLRIGYVSSDLREHAVGFLTAGMYGLHDRNKYEIFAYYCGTEAHDPTQLRIKTSVDHWVDISRMKDAEAARKIVDDEIDILVDLNGYTRDARTKVFAMRPAPVIVNWLGYPGSMGSPVHNYIVADEFIIPHGSEKYYSEKVLRLPCYQPNDRNRVVSPRHPTRAEAGLPDDAVVYCSFNGLQKLTGFTFQRWMTIMRNVPSSVLWTLGSTSGTNERVRLAAEAQGVARERIIFAAKVANPDHLARYTLADLFLDTTPYGAHTTASDALWMCVPVLTLPGRSFPSRVCGSLLKAAGVEELVCRTPEEYVERAIQLGKDPAALKRYRQRLAEHRDNSVLFDTQNLVHSLEKLYDEMWHEYCCGALPQPDLTNLDVYYRIGCEIDHDATEMQTVADYEGLYRRQLEYFNSFSPLPHDRRLWSVPAAHHISVSAPENVAVPPVPENAGWLTARTAHGLGQLRQ